MFNPTKLVVWIAVAASLVTLAPSPLLSPCTAQVTCAGGPTAGLFRLPLTSMGTGVMRGRLIDSSTNLPAYRLTARLVDVPSPCLSCVEGEIHGFLDDGSGTSPDFIVRGRYLGSFLGGSGQFNLRVFRPSGGPSVGTLSGSFDDPPGDGMPGQFSGVWQICQ
jgi:hypothetical protein